MKLLPFLAAAVVLVEVAGAAAFFLSGPWVLGVLLAVGAVCSVTVFVQVRRSARRSKSLQTAGYVQREQSFW